MKRKLVGTLKLIIEMVLLWFSWFGEFSRVFLFGSKRIYRTKKHKRNLNKELLGSSRRWVEEHTSTFLWLILHPISIVNCNQRRVSQVF